MCFGPFAAQYYQLLHEQVVCLSEMQWYSKSLALDNTCFSVSELWPAAQGISDLGRHCGSNFEKTVLICFIKRKGVCKVLSLTVLAIFQDMGYYRH